MLYYVSGPVTVLEPGLAVVDCNGVGYGCRVTAYTAGQLKLDQRARLYITESIREDAFDLYGFISKEEQRCFDLLTSVNGVGPKAAMAILSAGGPQNFTLAVMTGDEKLLTAAQGVGKRIAQRIILELKDKVGGSAMELDFSGPTVSAPVQQGGGAALATAALQELGYSPAEISTALKGVDPKASTEEMVRYALRAMVMKG
ncbi:MAG: Holliday junction branch migration protein RuvA [Oscillospiraceae bacterium]|nr:Holliday junction branch migration protein RuvA [Oscillospiraceae bacterium]